MSGHVNFVEVKRQVCRRQFRRAYRPDLPEADKVRLWALYAPILSPPSP